TMLGRDGASLSGGQAQRLAIAQSGRLAYYPVLFSDEATSALDPTSRVAVFDAVRCWRQGRTTIVVTHDLAQISGDDFVYVLKDGCVVENGPCVDLNTYVGGVFGSM
ncbi:P-loop containing nucleoside triphosphate hydrolase protein, partial [Mycena galopus ATCC 62051]